MSLEKAQEVESVIMGIKLRFKTINIFCFFEKGEAKYQKKNSNGYRNRSERKVE